MKPVLATKNYVAAQSLLIIAMCGRNGFWINVLLIVVALCILLGDIVRTGAKKDE